MIRNPSGDRVRDGSNDYCPECEVQIDHCTCPRDFGEPEPESDNATNETDCAYCEANKGDNMMPPHKASNHCESGKHNHCTCDICY